MTCAIVSCMSQAFGDASTWEQWAAVHELPQEHIKRVRQTADAEQGWPPGMIDEDSSKCLHDMGVKNTRYTRESRFF